VDNHFNPPRWGQIYILDALLRFVPEQHEEAELMAERVVAQLQHANSAVVLTTIKALLYLMNYMDNRKLIDYICKKMGPPLGTGACGYVLHHQSFTFSAQLLFSLPALRFSMLPSGTSCSSYNDDPQY
jgi:vesicle coat complex subunit